MAWLASDFLAELRRAVGIASASAVSPEGLTDAALLPLVDREVQLELVPLLVRAREEWLVLKQSVSITSSTTRVRIPARAVGGRVRDVRQTINGFDRSLQRYQPEEKARFFPLSAAAGSLAGYYLEGEWIVLIGAPQASTLDIYYPCRPGRLTITAADFRRFTAKVVTTTTQMQWTGDLDLTGASWDIVRGSSSLSVIFAPAVLVSSGLNFLTVSNANGEYLADPADALGSLGDYVTRADTSPVIPLPVELHSLLLQRSVAAVLRQLGKYDEASRERDVAEQLVDSTLGLLTPRVESQSKIAVGNLHWRRRRLRGGRW